MRTPFSMDLAGALPCNAPHRPPHVGHVGLLYSFLKKTVFELHIVDLHRWHDLCLFIHGEGILINLLTVFPHQQFSISMVPI